MPFRKFRSPFLIFQNYGVFHLLFIFFLSVGQGTGQIQSNLFFERQTTLLSATLPDTNSAYRYYLENKIFAYNAADSFKIGLHLNGNYQNGALSPYGNYEDNLFYLVSPYLHYAFSSRLTFDLRVNIENIRDRYVYPERVYWSDTFRGHRGGFEIAKMEYRTKHISVKFGRDYFMPGPRFYESLLFSRHSYPYDGFYLAFHNSRVEISTFYLSLNPMTTEGRLNQRHLNGHRISVNLKNGYIALIDVMLYGGVNQPIDWMAFNPLLLLYPYRKNKKHLDGNNTMMLEAYYTWQNWYAFAQFLLDDYQADRKTPEDLEPPEWGMNVTFGKENLFCDLHWKINYTHVANRTFNAPDKAFEKYIYKNYPIGHWLGNNFWELKTSFTYKGLSGFIADLTLSHTELGEEALYAPFNKDYLDHTVEEGYNEDFPFGPIRLQTGAQLKLYYNVMPNLFLESALSWWLQNDLLKNAFGLRIGAAYHL